MFLDGVGRDSPGALLDMLAEVASQTLHSEKKFTESVTTNVTTNKPQSKGTDKKKCHQETTFNSSQLLAMPATQLVKQFSLFTSDELKRQYSYTCALVPGCGQRYTSFASEGRARMSIKAHLADHLDFLKRDEEACKFHSSFTNNFPTPNRSNNCYYFQILHSQQSPLNTLETLRLVSQLRSRGCLIASRKNPSRY